jgi:LysR family transcriptional regulator, transcriptional activator of the cysJI operon
VQTAELDIRLLRTFRAIAETRSFAGSAEKLRLTRSCVIQQLNALERVLGVRLVKRTNKYVGLTAAGEIFLQCTGQVLDNLDRVRGMLAERTATASGNLSIGAPALFCQSLLPYVVGQFRVRFPAVALSVSTAEPHSMAARLAHRELDVALLPNPVSQQSLGTVRLGYDELRAIVPPQHPLARNIRVTARDLQGQPLIVPHPGNRLWAAWDGFLNQAGVFPNIAVDTDDLDLAKRLVLRGDGITVAPRWAVRAELERGELRAIPLGPGGVFREWCLAYHRGSELSGIRRNFLRTCQEEVPRFLSSETPKSIVE